MLDTMTIDTATGQIGLFDDTAPEYDAFVEKFKPKKTTDDCYTPENVHEAVMAWVEQEYGVNRADFLRPFWPGGDYRGMEYPAGCIVVDNPPFSLRKEIVDFYMDRDIRFFIYSPALTLIRRSDVCFIATGANITYENGAEVPTSFCTNLDRYSLRTAPELYRAIKAANDANLKALRKSTPKYIYPDHVVTAGITQRWTHHGVDFRLDPSECVIIPALDIQREAGKAIFGGGFLLSERAAAERAAAERAAAERAAAERAAAERAAAERAAAERAAATVWELSDREWDIVERLGQAKHAERSGSNGT